MDCNTINNLLVPSVVKIPISAHLDQLSNDDIEKICIMNNIKNINRAANLDCISKLINGEKIDDKYRGNDIVRKQRCIRITTIILIYVSIFILAGAAVLGMGLVFDI